eukprot:CAMPEP_0181202890 /NCGR_PEP_ID=MMETSP1096-20121128/19091_1 /TAXON_ID=156174 ORGANISM="Chrysochromulina ericina, Strain CCMP281" /NCGR_SAMPLE_ID=MMETSP1096 /ASSEMBLY_ACC=CAM_ASM_000453 /LENGTH=103 /DNA_ID=CAMNT_0023293449 /DNA_START=74 /DNA_END=385 /DNA_ORIENTATION=+
MHMKRNATPQHRVPMVFLHVAPSPNSYTPPPLPTAPIATPTIYHSTSRSSPTQRPKVLTISQTPTSSSPTSSSPTSSSPTPPPPCDWTKHMGKLPSHACTLQV